MQKIAYSYCRFSHRKQAHGSSIARQIARAQAWADANGFLLDTSLQDDGRSSFDGTNLKHALGQFLGMIGKEVKPGSVLVVESLDRLSRAEIDAALELFRGILRAGVDIVTLAPERIYTRQSLNDAFALVELIVIAQRAHEESKLKADRVGKAWANKRERISTGHRMTRSCPAWLQLSADRKRYEKKPDAVATVRLIFDWCIDGMGIQAIARKLNATKVPPIGRKKLWSSAYVRKILFMRSTLGEFQPRGKGRKPVGEVVKGYYPSIISEADYARAHNAIAGRRSQRGRRGTTITNLFTGIMHDAIDLSTVNLTDGRTFSQSSRYAKPGASRRYFPYRALEHAILELASGLQPADILPSTEAVKGAAKQLGQVDGEVAKIDHRLEQLSKAIENNLDEDVSDLLVTRTNLRKKRAALIETCERLRRELLQAGDNPLKETKPLISALTSAEGEKLIELRSRLRSRLRNIISQIWLYVAKVEGRQIAVVQVHFKAGGVRVLVVEADRSRATTAQSSQTLAGLEKDIRDKKVQKQLDKALGELDNPLNSLPPAFTVVNEQGKAPKVFVDMPTLYLGLAQLLTKAAKGKR